MNLFIIILLCPFYYAENKYLFLTLQNIHENTLAKIDNFIYFEFVSEKFKNYEEYLLNLESISLLLTNPGNEYNCYFMNEILNIFHIPKYIHFKSTFPLYEAEISRFLRPKICKILKQFNKSKISLYNFKNSILDIIKEEINNIEVYTFETKINLQLSSAYFYYIFYEKGLIKDEEPSRMHYSRKICNSNTKTLKSILMDELQFKFIEIREYETNFNVVNILYQIILNYYTNFPSYNIFICVNFDPSLLVLNYFLKLQQEHTNSYIDKQIILFKLLMYIKNLYTIFNHNTIKREIELHYGDKSNIKIAFRSENFNFFIEYMKLNQPDFFQDSIYIIRYFEYIKRICIGLSFELNKIKFD